MNILNSTKILYLESKALLYNLLYDRHTNNQELLKKATLINKSSCVKHQDSLNHLAGLLTNVCVTNPIEGGSKILKDKTLEFYTNNPECTPLELWEKVAKNIEYNYKVIVTVKDVSVQKAALSSYIKNDINAHISKNTYKEKNPEIVFKISNFEPNSEDSISQIQNFQKEIEKLDLKIKSDDKNIYLVSSKSIDNE